MLASVEASAQSVVVNKYFDSGDGAGIGDAVELLVVQDGLDMRGMIIKDFSGNMGGDGGGKYQFSTNALWSGVRAGTLIVLRFSSTSTEDTIAGGEDFNLDIRLSNATYFTNLGGSFNLSTTDMAMIKATGSDPAGVTGSIHVLAGGTAGSQFTSAPTPKLITSLTAGANFFIYANNSTSTLADFNGTDATGHATGLTFGSGNNATNTAYINSLRSSGPVTEPTIQASGVQFTNVAATSLTLSWTNGNGASRIVLARQGSAVDAAPADGTSYTASGTFGNGSQIGTGNFVVYAGSSNSVNVTGLSPATNYYFAVFEYNGFGVNSDYLTASPATGNVTTASAFTVSGNIVNGGANLSGITVTLTGGASPLTTTTDASGNYSFADVAAGGNYTVTASSNLFNLTPASQTLNNLNGNATANFTASSKIIISEFRFHGVDPDGEGALIASTNEYVELYNNSDDNIDISGWSVVASDNPASARFTVAGTFASGTTKIPARGHYLLAGASYSLAACAAADASLGADIPDNAGVALFSSTTSFTGATRMDSVGFGNVSDALFKESAGLTPASGTSTDGEYAFVRKATTTSMQDTGDNAADFIFVSTDGGSYDGIASVLGAPAPENLASPTTKFGNLVYPSYVDPLVASSAAPNRVRSGSGNSGTLTIRRRFTNSTGSPVTRLRFRIYDVTTLGSPGGGAGSGQADLRAVTSGDTTVTITGGGSVPVLGTTLEQSPQQPNGGGINSTLSVSTIELGQPLADGSSINVQYVLNVALIGRFRFFVNVEALAQSSNVNLTMGNPSGATPDVNQPHNYLMEKLNYVLAYDRDRGEPIWTSWHLSAADLGSAPRQNDFRADTTLPAGWYQVQSTDYTNSGYTRGHMTPSADRTATIADNSAVFLMTNMIPQTSANNGGPWNDLEIYSRSLATAGAELYIISGGSGNLGTFANGHVVIPNQTWKVIIVIPSGDNDVSRVNTATRTIAVIMPNTTTVNADWRSYRVSVDQVEALTGFDFFSNVPVPIQNVIEASVDNQ
jgi:endonuclease G